MLNQISWNTYFVFVAVALGLYYITILALYYRKSFQAKAFKLSDKTIWRPQTTERLPYHVRDGHSADDEASFYSLIDELNAFFEQARKSKCIKEELVQSLRAIISKYSITDHSYYKESLTSLIMVQCENICSLQLSENDMAMVWK